MAARVDTASRLVRASSSTIYNAFASADALATWLPPKGMTGSVLAFDFREGGSYQMRLSYIDEGQPAGKTSETSDDVRVRFLVLDANRRIEQEVNFRTQDPTFLGEMRIVWTFEETNEGTNVTVSCENVPVGIRPEDHEAGLLSTLENLAAFTEGRA